MHLNYLVEFSCVPAFTMEIIHHTTMQVWYRSLSYVTLMASCLVHITSQFGITTELFRFPYQCGLKRIETRLMIGRKVKNSSIPIF